MDEKYYQLGTHTSEQWCEIHHELTEETSGLSTIPDRCVTCHDDKPHSPTRGTFLLTDEEASRLKADPRIKFINLDFSLYPEQFKAPADELHSTNAELLSRWQEPVKIYREFVTSGTLPGSPNTTDYNRSGYQLLRPMQKLDPWVNNTLAENAVVNTNIQQFADGRDVDVIVGDDGTWIGHPEFQNNTTGAKPTDYVGGNVLPGGGTCDVLDLVLDGPYYLDPDYFDADPASRLTTRWDGTRVPVESVARNWWLSTANRSSVFNTKYPDVGTVSITSLYTRAYNNGSNSVQSTVGNHGTACCALAFGRTQGWAYNANKWTYNHYNVNGTDIEQGFDLEKIFHITKPVNPKYGTKNPTVSSNSWGYRANKGTTNGYYHFRTDGPVQYGGVTAEPPFISGLGSQGDGGRWKSEMKSNSYTVALDELINSGVIFVVAAGNSNQKQVKWDHPDYGNFVSALSTDTISDSSYFEFGIETTGSTNRRGFPQQGGKFNNGNAVVYPAISVGALDDNFSVGGLERKVGYSDRGNDIDVYAPADGTLVANRGYTPAGRYPDTYPGFTADSGSGAGVPEDAAFSGTSAACPVTAGFIACLMSLNRSWTWIDVKNYLQSLETQVSNDFYYGTESSTATDSNWTDYNSLEGGDARVLYQGTVEQSSFPQRKSRFANGLSVKGIQVNYIQKFDRG